MKEAQQSSGRRERREDSRAEQAAIVHLTQLRETQEDQEDRKDQEKQTSEVTPRHDFHTVWVFSFKRPNTICSIIWEHLRHPHHMPVAGRQLQNQVVEGISSWSRGTQAVKDPRLWGGLGQGGGVPVLQHRCQVHTDTPRQQLVSTPQRLQQDVAALHQVTW